MTGNEPIALGPTKRLGQYLVGNAVQGVVEVLVAASTLGELRYHPEHPATPEHGRHLVRHQPLVRHTGLGSPLLNYLRLDQAWAPSSPDGTNPERVAVRRVLDQACAGAERVADLEQDPLRTEYP